MPLDNSAQILKKHSLFENLSEDVLKHMEKLLIHTNYKTGDYIFHEGDRGEEIYFLISGIVDINTENKQGEIIELTSLNEGDVFGEMAILTEMPRTANALSKSDSSLLSLKKKDFDLVVAKYSSVSLALCRMLSEKLSAADKMLTKKELNKNVLLITTLNDESHIQHFVDYLKKISSRDVVILENIIATEVIKQNKLYQNKLFLILDKDNSLEDLADNVINFLDQQPGHIFIKDSSSIDHIERAARIVSGKTIGVALSSGTAPGLAHLGVMKVFIENNIPLDYITGTSGGSIYGSGFAFGYSYEEIYKVFSTIYKKPLYHLYDFSFKFIGLFKGMKLLSKTVVKLLGNKNIEDSIIPFAAVATDLITGKEIVHNSGNLISAIRSSMSIPIMFTPVVFKNKLLVDGVVTTPIPIGVLEQENIDIKIGVYVQALDDVSDKKFNFMSVFHRARNISADFIADASIERADVILKPKMEGLQMFEYNRIDEIIKSGEDTAYKALPRIRRLLYGKGYASMEV